MKKKFIGFALLGVAAVSAAVSLGALTQMNKAKENTTAVANENTWIDSVEDENTFGENLLEDNVTRVDALSLNGDGEDEEPEDEETRILTPERLAVQISSTYIDEDDGIEKCNIRYVGCISSLDVSAYFTRTVYDADGYVAKDSKVIPVTKAYTGLQNLNDEDSVLSAEDIFGDSFTADNYYLVIYTMKGIPYATCNEYIIDVTLTVTDSEEQSENSHRSADILAFEKVGNEDNPTNDTDTFSFEKVAGGYSVKANNKDMTECTIPRFYYEVPEEGDDYFVYRECDIVAIADNGFSNCSSLETVEFEKDADDSCAIKTIGTNAFSETSITSVEIPDSVTSIGDSAFSGTSISEITIPDTVTSIEANAFAGCTEITEITIPSTVTSIGANAFKGCADLTSVTIDSYTDNEDNEVYSLTSIGDSAFEGTGINSIDIPDSVTSIGANAFKDCESLESVTIGYIDNDDNEVSSLTSIGDSAFSGCTGITSIGIPDSVTSIGDSAFEGTSIKSIEIPATVTSVGDNVFEDIIAYYFGTKSESDINLGTGNDNFYYYYDGDDEFDDELSEGQYWKLDESENHVVFVVDKNSDITTEKTYSNDELSQMTTYAYSDDGVISKKEYNYEGDDAVIKYETTYKYSDSTVNLMTIIEYQVTNDTVYPLYEITYDGDIEDEDANAHMTEYKEYYGDGALQIQKLYEYNTEGICISYVYLLFEDKDDSTPSNRDVYTYDDNGNIVEKVQYENEIGKTKVTYEYDAAGNLTNTISYSWDGSNWV